MVASEFVKLRVLSLLKHGKIISKTVQELQVIDETIEQKQVGLI